MIKRSLKVMNFPFSACKLIQTREQVEKFNSYYIKLHCDKIKIIKIEKLIITFNLKKNIGDPRTLVLKLNQTYQF